MRSSSLGALCLLVLAAFSTRATRAEATEEDSKTFFAQGRQLRAAGNCADAIVAFRRALEAFPQGLGSLRNIAECEEKLGQYASARNDWWSLRRAVLLSNEPKYEGWDKDAEQGYARLADKVANITIRIQGADPAELTITIDGKPLDPRLVGVELERDLGPHIIQAAYGGGTPVSEKRTLIAGAHEVVMIKIPARKTPSTPPTVIIMPAAPPEKGSPELRMVGAISLAVGGAGVLGTVIAVAVRGTALAQIDSECPDHTNCPRDLIGARDSGVTASVLANVFVGLAAVGVGAGVPLLVVGYKISPSSSPPPQTKITAKLELMPLAGGAGARLGVRF